VLVGRGDDERVPAVGDEARTQRLQHGAGVDLRRRWVGAVRTRGQRACARDARRRQHQRCDTTRVRGALVVLNDALLSHRGRGSLWANGVNQWVMVRVMKDLTYTDLTYTRREEG
jgi:hypothetical protein